MTGQPVPIEGDGKPTWFVGHWTARQLETLRPTTLWGRTVGCDVRASVRAKRLGHALVLVLPAEGKAYPVGRDQLAGLTGMGSKTVPRAADDLEALGLLVRETSPGRATVWRPCWPPEHECNGAHQPKTLARRLGAAEHEPPPQEPHEPERDDEPDQGRIEEVITMSTSTDTPPATLDDLHALKRGLGVSSKRWREALERRYGVERTADLGAEQRADLAAAIRRRLAADEAREQQHARERAAEQERLTERKAAIGRLTAKADALGGRSRSRSFIRQTLASAVGAPSLDGLTPRAAQVAEARLNAALAGRDPAALSADDVEAVLEVLAA